MRVSFFHPVTFGMTIPLFAEKQNVKGVKGGFFFNEIQLFKSR